MRKILVALGLMLLGTAHAYEYKLQFIPCAYVVTYDPTTIQCTPSTQGLVYTTITLTLATDAGENFDFTQIYTVTGVPVCDD